MGKFLAVLIVSAAVLGGAAMYYFQVYAYYEPVNISDVPAMQGATRIQLTSITTDQPEPILIADFQGIDATSSPLRFRGCFTTRMSIAMLTETYLTYEGAVPLIAPHWFGCFDAQSIGRDIEDGQAFAFLSERDIVDGIDRVVAVYDDGRAYAWHQLNEKYRN
ncbi:MAG: DUF6446 family protein [Paracoccaceae bacterium]